MALISDVLGIVVAIVIFIFLVLLFFKIFGSPECVNLAKATAEELRIAIDKVALEDKISPWNKEGIPEDNAKNQFVSVPIRLCQRAGAGGAGFSIPFTPIGFRIENLGTGGALSAETPDYILVYETWPENIKYAGGFLSGWSEEQPFSGGAVNSIATYAAIRWGPKIIMNLGKFVAKLPGRIVKLLIKFPVLGEKILNYLGAHRDNKIIRWLLRSAFGSAQGKSIALNMPERFIEDFYGKEYKSTIATLRTMVLEDGIDEFEAMANLGLIESEWDDIAGKYVPITAERYYYKGVIPGVVKDEMYVVNPEFRHLFKTYIELAPNEELKQLYKNTFYIPSWGSRFGTEKIKQKWYKFEYSILHNRFTKWFSDKVIKPTKDTYYDFRDGFREVFHLSPVNRFDSPVKTAAYKKWAFMHFDQFRDYVLDEDNFYNIGFQRALEDVTGKFLSNPSLVSDEDLYKFLVKYDRYYNTFPYEEFISSSTGQIRSFAVNNLKDIIDDSADIAIKKGDWGAWVTFKNKWGLAWDQMTDQQKDNWVSKFMKGYTGSEGLSKYDAGVIYSDFRAQLIKGGVLEQSKIITHGQIRTGMFQNMIDNVKGEMFSLPLRRYDFIKTDEFANAIPNFWLRRTAPATKDWFQMLREKFSKSITALKDFKDELTKNKLYKKTKQFVILDLGRFGSGPLSPFDPLGGGGPYTMRESLRRSTQVIEGGCSERSICMLKAGGVEGPEPGASAFLLDEEVPIGTKVKLWRPKPGLNVRTPTWISTSLFYATVTENPRFHLVSPCFAVAKVWKSGVDGSIYVDIDKGGKCNVTGCPSGIDTPNYCYADEDYMWGESAFDRGNMITTGDAPSASIYVGGALGCAAVMTIATHGNFWSSLKTCSYISIGILTVHTIGATIPYRDVQSWKRQETGWGYWNYQKAGDVCDILDLMASLGGWQAGKGAVKLTETQPGAWWTKSAPGTLSKLGGKLKSNLGMGDLCFFLLVVGDTSLSWPIKTTFPEIWRKGAGLNSTCMEESTAECVWLEKTV